METYWKQSNAPIFAIKYFFTKEITIIFSVLLDKTILHFSFKKFGENFGFVTNISHKGISYFKRTILCDTETEHLKMTIFSEILSFQP
jgi:hypothetical protein